MEIEQIVEKYGDMLFRICLINLGNKQDTHDAVQETLLRFLEQTRKFQNEEHIKAWLIRVAMNVCKDMRRFKMRHPLVRYDELQDYYTTNKDFGILEEVMSLPYKQKAVIYLYYVEGYRTIEIANLLHISESVVRKRMQRGREQLKLQYLKGEKE